jgi:hypothetical protein
MSNQLQHYRRNKEKINEKRREKYLNTKRNLPTLFVKNEEDLNENDRCFAVAYGDNKDDKEYICVADKSDDNRKIKSYMNVNRDFKQIPVEVNKRDCLYICAPNQSGKTTYVARYLELYKKRFPNKTIYLFSKLDEDPILDKFEPIRVNINKLKLRNNTLDFLKNSLVIFDDVDQILEKENVKKIQKLINEILCNGAHYNIGIIVTNHLLSDYKNTRCILNECSSITVFPKSGCAHHLEYLLKNYIGFDRNQINRLKDIDSRWVTIFKNYPQIVLYENGAYLP